MKLSPKEWKSLARRNLIGRYGILIFCIVLTEMISFLLSAVFLTQNISGWLFVLCGFIISLLTSVLYTGLGYMYLQTARDQAVRVQDLFFALNHSPDTVLLIGLFIRAGALLSAAPLYLMTLLLDLRWQLYDALTVSSAGAALQILGLYLLFFLLWAVLFAAIMLRYAMACFIYLDHPAWSMVNILRESRNRMSGHLLTYAKLLLSFVGMLLMGVLSFGIGLLWVMPYIYVSSAQFYLDLTDQLSPEFIHPATGEMNTHESAI